MQDLSFLYIAFFLTVGSFFIGFLVSWNVKDVFDIWVAKADYAAIKMHPEMYEDGELIDEQLLYLRIDNDVFDDEDD